MFNANLEIIDAATPFLQYMAQTKPDWMRKALKSAGWWMQQEIKKGIRSGAPGGQAYPDSVPVGIRNALRAYYGGKDKRKFPPLGKLVNAVGYQYKESDQAVLVGWLSQSSVKLGEKIEAGSDKTVTDKMKRFFFASGVPLTESKITVAPRKTFGPMKVQLEPQIAGYMEQKIIDYMNGVTPSSSRKSRRYTVRG